MTASINDPEVQAARIERLKVDNQFGCDGRHHGDGSPECPRQLHHHHDWFCRPPTPHEWQMAGRTGPVWWSSRAGAGGDR